MPNAAGRHRPGDRDTGRRRVRRRRRVQAVLGRRAVRFRPGAGGTGACGRFLPAVCQAYQQIATTGHADQQTIDLLRADSPVSVTSHITVPTLLVQGEQDTLFGLDQADANARQIAAAGGTVKMIWYDGGHDGARRDTALRSQIGDWFRHYLLGQGPKPAGTFSYDVQGTLRTDGVPSVRTVTAAGLPRPGRRRHAAHHDPPDRRAGPVRAQPAGWRAVRDQRHAGRRRAAGRRGGPAVDRTCPASTRRSPASRCCRPTAGRRIVDGAAAGQRGPWRPAGGPGRAVREALRRRADRPAHAARCRRRADPDRRAARRRLTGRRDRDAAGHRATGPDRPPAAAGGLDHRPELRQSRAAGRAADLADRRAARGAGRARRVRLGRAADRSADRHRRRAGAVPAGRPPTCCCAAAVPTTWTPEVEDVPLVLAGLAKSYRGGVVAVDDLSFRVERRARSSDCSGPTVPARRPRCA